MIRDSSPKNKNTYKSSTITQKKVQSSSQKESTSNSDDKRSKTNSLVKYDTPFLVSTTVGNKKKKGGENEDSSENAEKFLRKIMNVRVGEVKNIMLK
jgi:hypothetical protein